MTTIAKKRRARNDESYLVGFSLDGGDTSREPLARPRDGLGSSPREIPEGIRQISPHAYEARARVGGGRRISIATGSLDHVVAALAEHRLAKTYGETLHTYAATWFKNRERERVADVKGDRARYERHIADTDLARMPMAHVESKHVRAFPVLVHALMLTDKRVQRAVAEALGSAA